jgi:endosialidase-like protein
LVHFRLRAIPPANSTLPPALGRSLPTSQMTILPPAPGLLSNTIGFNNTANGAFPLFRNTSGNDNTANGAFALFRNTTGSFNVAVGYNAATGLTTGGNNIALGTNAGVALTTGSFNIDIGNIGEAEDSTIRIGTVGTQTATYIAGISGTAVIGNAVVVDSNGQLGTVASAARFKKEIKPMDKASEAILALNPVTFQYKIDKTSTPQFGLIAEDVEKVNPDLVVRDKKGKPYSVRYDQVNAMLLNEFLKEHRKVEKLETTVATAAQRFSNGYRA